MDKPRLAFIGGGNMAKSLIGGLIDKGFSSRCISVSDPVEKNLDQLNRKFGIATTSDNSIAAKDVDLIVLCVKPQILESVCRELQASLNQTPPAISIAAGIPLSLLMDWLGEDTPIIRCMPNTPALVQSGAAGMFANQKVDKKLRNLAEEIFDAVGLCCWLEKEEDIDLVTAVSGSGPAYFFLFMEAMEKVAIDLGLDQEISRKLIIQTVLGAAKMAAESDMNPSELRSCVTSPGGTTEKAVNAFLEGDIMGLFNKAMNKALERATEMAKEAENNTQN
ncbi:MAG: pyrroline-5-carboxylate reductase [Cellvibrionales bacterium]|nr:pyrroline-5-carboxylate reductase [Cellvibrionales bacterium]